MRDKLIIYGFLSVFFVLLAEGFMSVKSTYDAASVSEIRVATDKSQCVGRLLREANIAAVEIRRRDLASVIERCKKIDEQAQAWSSE
ncbi:hypothetical protein ACF8FF_07080 [Pseudomonas sp. zjy_13]|uniref:hypothetical protein n=1 Tax=Pseudomonas sp. zjy_13 TaxID=3367263 RepID=UPI00370A22A8